MLKCLDAQVSFNVNENEVNNFSLKIELNEDSLSGIKEVKSINIDNISFKIKENDYLLYHDKEVEIIKLLIKDKYTYRNSNISSAIFVPVNGSFSIDKEVADLNKVYVLGTDSNCEISGEGLLFIVRIPKYLIGLDVGGTNVKGMIIDDLGHIVSETKNPTEASLGYDKIIDNMNLCVNSLYELSGLNREDFTKIGVGFPGSINQEKGLVLFSNNLFLKNVYIGLDFEKVCGLKVLIENDANCAALGEYMFTSKKKYHDMILITLGTGVGSGIIINSDLFRGGFGSGAEIGHMKVKTDKYGCTCGQYGCLESLLSLKRLSDDVAALIDDPSTHLSELMSKEDSPLEIFKYDKVNDAARDYSFKFQNNLLLGLSNICSIFQPEIIAIGGGVSYSIAKYIKSLEYRMNKFKFAGFDAPKVRLVQAQLGNEAGSFGACALTLK